MVTLASWVADMGSTISWGDPKWNSVYDSEVEVGDFQIACVGTNAAASSRLIEQPAGDWTNAEEFAQYTVINAGAAMYRVATDIIATEFSWDTLESIGVMFADTYLLRFTNTSGIDDFVGNSHAEAGSPSSIGIMSMSAMTALKDDSLAVRVIGIRPGGGDEYDISMTGGYTKVTQTYNPNSGAKTYAFFTKPVNAGPVSWEGVSATYVYNGGPVMYGWGQSFILGPPALSTPPINFPAETMAGHFGRATS